MNKNQAETILVRTFGYILRENEGIVTDDIDGTKYFVYRNDGLIKISKVEDDLMIPGQNYKPGKWVWLYDKREDALDAILDDHIAQKEIEDMTKSKEIT